MQLSDFNYHLPQELIAQYPAAKRSESRLMCLSKDSHDLTHKRFFEVINLIEAGDLLVFNNTKVIPARLFGHKATGGRVEILVERILDQHRFIAQLRVSKPPKSGDKLLLPDNVQFEVVSKQHQFYELKCTSSNATVLQVIEKLGEIPLPHYMQREAEESDKERYQTVYAEHKGSVAAPTAGFHFDEALLQALRDKGVEFGFLTLHIGAGTFSPVRTENIAEHVMHAEYLEVTPELCQQIQATKARGNRVIAVGTTSVRALETASKQGQIQPFYNETQIFIYPGYQFNCVDALITNLHLPGSTLLMLVSAFAGYEKVMHAYEEAVKQGYHFFSYGDAMFMERV